MHDMHGVTCSGPHSASCDAPDLRYLVKACVVFKKRLWSTEPKTLHLSLMLPSDTCSMNTTAGRWGLDAPGLTKEGTISPAHLQGSLPGRSRVC